MKYNLIVEILEGGGGGIVLRGIFQILPLLEKYQAHNQLINHLYKSCFFSSKEGSFLK